MSFPTPEDVRGWLKVDVHLGVERTIIQPAVLLKAIEDALARSAAPTGGPIRTVSPDAFVESLFTEVTEGTWPDGTVPRVMSILRKVEGYLLPDKPLGTTYFHTEECGLAKGEEECTCGARP